MKSALRFSVKSSLKRMSNDIRSLQSFDVVNQLLKSDVYKDAKHVSVYLSMPTEVQTLMVVEDLLKSGRSCYIPYYTVGNDSHMRMLHLKSLKDLHSLPKTKWNIPQPTEDDIEGRKDALEEGTLDLVITPGVAFTEEGHRLGHGKGFYDRFFEECEHRLSKRPYTIGLAYSCQMVDTLPTSSQDYKLDRVISPLLKQ